MIPSFKLGMNLSLTCFVCKTPFPPHAGAFLNSYPSLDLFEQSKWQSQEVVVYQRLIWEEMH